MDPKERIKKLTNDIEDGADGRAEKEEGNRDAHQTGLELTRSVGRRADHDTLWWHLGNVVRASDSNTHTDHQHDICKTIFFFFWFRIDLVISLLIDEIKQKTKKGVCLPIFSLHAIGGDTKEHEHVVALKVREVVVESRRYT